MLLLIMLLNTSTFPYFRATKNGVTSLLLVPSAMSRLRVCFGSASCLLALGPKQTAIKHIAERYLKNFSTNHISTTVFSQKTELEKFRIIIAECQINANLSKQLRLKAHLLPIVNSVVDTLLSCTFGIEVLKRLFY